MECRPAVRVLLVGDDCDGANSTAMLLRHFGAEVRAVYDSRLACGEALLFEPNLMLIDLSMPHLDGCAIARQLRSTQQFSATPLAVVSGPTDAEHPAACAAAGFDEYLIKPVPLELLVRLLEEIRTVKALGEAARGRSPSHIRLGFGAMEAVNQ
jgi:CheY-like chemotaxis protein